MQFQDPEKFVKEGGRLYRKWADNRPDTVPEVEDETLDVMSTIEEAGSEIEIYMQKMPPYDFQNLVAALLRAVGYYVSWIAPPGPDKGIDILAHMDPLGTTAPRIKVQVKRRADKINAEGLRSFMAVIGDQDVAFLSQQAGLRVKQNQRPGLGKVTCADPSTLGCADSTCPFSTEIQGGIEQPLTAGDILYVPPGVPHGFKDVKGFRAFLIRFDLK